MTAVANGRRVVITRPRASARGMAADLEARGMRPILLPTVTVRPVGASPAFDALVDRLGHADWLLCTSAAAVRALQARLTARGIGALPPTLRVAAVGPATAAALGRIGARVDVVPATHSGRALVESLGDLRHREVLFPRSDIARADTLEALRAAGAVLHDAVAYRTLPSRPHSGSLRELERGVDAITFTSPSTAGNFLRLLGARAGLPLERAVIGCIGPTTAAAARQIGARTIVVPPVATAAALVAAIAGHFDGGRR